MDNAAKRMGKRIKEIRKASKMTQDELAKEVGVTVDLIRKYENGQRKASPETFAKLLDALSVSEYAIADPIAEDPIGAMFCLFEMEDEYGLEFDKNNLHIGFKSSEINSLLKVWKQQKQDLLMDLEYASSDKEKEKLKKDYAEWKRRYPGSLSQSKEERIGTIQQRIKELEEELNELQRG